MILYTKDLCPECMFLKFELDRYNIQIEEINIDHHENVRQELIEKNIKKLPVLKIGDDFYIHKFEILKRLLFFT